MLQDTTSSSLKKIFTGIRFVLFGFDSVSEAQYKSELVRRDGIDVGRYDLSCTHVIVSGRVYDDPVCVAARHDGKTLVTELWIEDSVDFGKLVDPNRIFYRPVKDLNGIPGSESLLICLTGYQRQERDDIMKMVSLMGARFSKPLIANQVTHLVCYKFEGEKYELAKKVNIKLINHRWLEDCLKAWEIIPIDNYTKSGWELEILEAEARDSEDETEDEGIRILGKTNIVGTSSMLSGMPISKASNKSIPTVQMYNVQQGTVTPEQSHSAKDLADNRLLSTPCKENSFGKSLDMCSPKDKVLEDFNHQDVRGLAQAVDGCDINDTVKGEDVSIQCDDNYKEGNALSSMARATKSVSPQSQAINEKFSTASNSTKSPRKLVSPEEPSANLRVSPLGSLEKYVFKSDLNLSPFAVRQARTNLESAETQSPTASADIHHIEASNNALPQKRKVSSPGIGLKSPKSVRQNSKACSPQGPLATARYAPLEPTVMVDVPPGKVDGCLADISHSLRGDSASNSMANQHALPSKFSVSYKKKALKRGHPVAGMKTSSSTASPSNGKARETPSNAQPMQTTDEHDSRRNDLPALKTKTTSAIASPMDDKVIPYLPLDVEQRQTVDGHISTSNTANYCRESTLDGKNTAKISPKERTSGKSLGGLGEFELASTSHNCDIAMSDMPNVTTNETGQAQEPQQDEKVLSPDGRDSETKKLSGTASAGICKEKNGKEQSGAQTKKVVAKRNLSWRPKLSTGNTGKDRSVACSDKTVTSNNAALESGKVNAEAELKQATNGPKNKRVKSVPKVKAIAVEDTVKVEQHLVSTSNSKNTVMDWMETSMDPEKENKPKENGSLPILNKHSSHKVVVKPDKKSVPSTKNIGGSNSNEMQTSWCIRPVIPEPIWFILSGHRLQKKEFQMVIRRLKGRLCRDSHHWSYQATHFIVPDPVRRTEKFFAAAAAGRWILKTDYLTASNEAGKFLEEEPFEWYRNGLSEDGAINLEVPRKWRLLRERTGHGALYGMRIVIYGECIAPTLDTLKRVVKAGDGTILATSPPYTRFLKSGVDFAIVCSSMPRVDSWVQEFLRHEIPCVVADYLVEYVCKPGYSLERHVLYKTQAWAEKSFANLLSRSEEIVNNATTPEESVDDINCVVCGSCERGEVMLICGDESGSVGCGIGTHIDCCQPPLEAVPEEDWFCPECSRSRVSKTPLKVAKKGSSSKHR